MDCRDLQTVDPGGQMQLLPESITEDMLSRREIEQGICSGDKLKHYDPATYERVINLLADGTLSQRTISRLCGVSRNLVSGVARSQHADIEPVKQRIASKARNLADLCIERAEEIVRDDSSKIGLKDLLIGAAVMVDKSLVLSGQASSIVEFRQADPAGDEFDRALSRARRVDCVEVAAIETGIEAEDFRAKGGEVAGDLPGQDGAQ
jgi:hypothetical protein